LNPLILALNLAAPDYSRIISPRHIVSTPLLVFQIQRISNYRRRAPTTCFWETPEGRVSVWQLKFSYQTLTSVFDRDREVTTTQLWDILAIARN
jgi:hypothetical protein